MVEKTATCAKCNGVFPLKQMRFMKIDGDFKYLCGVCRSQAKLQSQ